MCTGLEIAAATAALGASAGGNYMQQQENNANTQREYNARNDAMAAGVKVQDANAAKSTNVLNSTVSKFQQPQQQQDLGSLITKRTNAINANDVTPAAINPNGAVSTAPNVVNSDLANRMAGATAYANQQGSALGSIGGVGDQLLGNSLALNDSGNQIGQISNFAKGDAGVNQAQINAAGHNARKASSGIGQLLSTVGNVGSMYVAGGGLSPKPTLPAGALQSGGPVTSSMWSQA